MQRGVAKAVAAAVPKCETDEDVRRELQHLGVAQPLFRYLLYRDIRQYFPKLPESHYIGEGGHECSARRSELFGKSIAKFGVIGKPFRQEAESCFKIRRRANPIS